MGEWLKIIKWALVLAVAIVVVGGLYVVFVAPGGTSWAELFKSPFVLSRDVGKIVLGKNEPTDPAKSVDEKDRALQLDCLTAQIAKDVEGERATLVGAARNEVGDAVLRLIAKYPTLTYCDVFKGMLTSFPPGWDHKKNATITWKDRSVNVVYAGKDNSAWTSAQIVARAKYRTTPDPEKCAMFYIRADYNYLTAPFSGEKKGAAELRKMKKDPALEARQFKTDFRCLS